MSRPKDWIKPAEVIDPRTASVKRPVVLTRYDEDQSAAARTALTLALIRESAACNVRTRVEYEPKSEDLMSVKAIVALLMALGSTIVSGPTHASERPVDALALPSIHGSNPMGAHFRGDPVSTNSRFSAINLPASKADAFEQGKPRHGPIKVGVSKREALGKFSAAELQFTWTKVDDGTLGHFTVTSAAAAALRVAIAVSTAPDGMEITVASVAGSEGLRLQSEQIADAVRENNGVVWTPVTAGPTQVIEIWVPNAAGLLNPEASVVDVSHLVVNPTTPEPSSKASAVLKSALACHQNYKCSSDSTVTTVGKAVAKLVITSNGNSYLCSGALITDRAGTGTPHFATAYHCGVNTNAVASSLQFVWFYEQACGTTTANPAQASTYGSTLLMADRANDFTLLRANGALPSNLVLLGWDPAEVPIGTAVAGVHHPDGDFKKFSYGHITTRGPVSFVNGANGFLTIPANTVVWSIGLTQGGSSGSPLVTQDGRLRGVLSAGPIGETCSSPHLSYYSRFSQAYAKARYWIDPPTTSSDDWPNSASATLQTQTAPFETTAQLGTINSPSDQDWFRFSFSEPGIWFVFSDSYQGSNTNTYGRLYAPNGTTLLAENDNDPLGTLGSNFALYERVNVASTYFLQVTGSGGATGRYELDSIFFPSDDHADIYQLGTPLPTNGAIAGTLNREGDLDSFSLTISTPGTISIYSTGSTDLYAVLLDNYGYYLDSNDDINFPTDLNFSFNGSIAPGKYYLSVGAYDGFETGPYGIYVVFTPTATPTTANTAVEYFHTAMGHYFITAAPSETSALDSGAISGWARTGQSFKVYPLNTSGAANVCRFFSTSFYPKSSHFYTPSSVECSGLKFNPNWQFEANVFALKTPDATGNCASGTLPLYRLYNNGKTGAPNHRYTTSLTIRAQMTLQGFSAEGYGSLGVVGCVPQ